MKKFLTVLLLIFGLYVTFHNPTTLYARKLFYAEEFYLYVMNLYHENPNLLRNIQFMQWALRAPFDNPARSLARITTPQEFKRYKLLFKLHVTLLIVDSYLQLAHRFDKEHLYFFNYWYAQDLKESFTLAKFFYKRAAYYWQETQRYVPELGKVSGRIDRDQWEDELFNIEEGNLDFTPLIESRLRILDDRIQKLDTYLSQQTKK